MSINNVEIPDVPEKENYQNYKYKLSPFKLQVLQNFPYIEADFDAITNYQLLCKVVDYLNQVIDNMNTTESIVQTQIENIDALYNAYVELHTYIDNYFKNLDVQDEINNKLDEMAEDGTIGQIIEPFLNSRAEWAFDTVAEMKLATNLINGSYTYTLGFYNINDGGASHYKIRTKTNEDVINEYDLISLYDENLVAEYIEDKTVNIKQLGYIDTMTESIQASFLNYVFNKYKNILIKNENITINNTLQVKSNQTIKMFSSKIHNTSTTNQTFIFQLNGASNVNISGVNCELYFNKPNLAQQACLKIGGNCDNILFSGFILKDAGGDGITAGGATNVTIDNCTIDNSNRNGISLIGDIKGFYIKNCLFKNTIGQNPQYAIDLEPWQDEHYNEEVVIEQCTFIDNFGGSIDIMPYNRNITIINNEFNNDNISSVMHVEYGENAYPKNIVIKNNKFNNCSLYLRGLQYAEYIIDSNKFNIGGISSDEESDFVSFYNKNPKIGSLIITNNIIKNSTNHSININGGCNVIITNNFIEKSYNRCVSFRQCNNVNVINNTFKDHAQNETDTIGISTINFSTTHNIKIDGNLFIDSNTEITFTRLILFDANCQKLICVNNNALNSRYNNFIGKYGTITNEVNANNLLNT